MFLIMIKYESVFRWGFAGMPASHGVTKSHRRAGHIGSGKHLEFYFIYIQGCIFSVKSIPLLPIFKILFSPPEFRYGYAW